jgi:DNA-3-methyladenine glycosylase
MKAANSSGKKYLESAYFMILFKIMDFKKLPVEFYKNRTLKVARELLGHYLVRKINGNFLVGKIVETEAYREDDPASHSFKGKTERNKIMFLEGGHLYVYFTYGMYYCSNIVTEEEGFGSAVLLRSIEPVEGLDIMQKNRGKECSTINLANGPGKLCIAFQIDKQLNGKNLFEEDIFIAENKNKDKFSIGISPRIGITDGNEKLWRFFIKENKFVSKYKPQKQLIIESKKIYAIN